MFCHLPLLASPHKGGGNAVEGVIAFEPKWSGTSLNRNDSIAPESDWPEHGQHSTMNRAVSGDDLAGAEHVRSPGEVGDEAAGFPDHDAPGCDIPGLETSLPVSVKASRGGPGQVNCRSTRAPEAGEVLHCGARLTQEELVSAAAAVRDTRRHNGVRQGLASGHAQPLVIHEGTLALL